MYHFGVWCEVSNRAAKSHTHEGDRHTLVGLAYGRDVAIEVGCNQGGLTRLLAQCANRVIAVDWFKGDWAAGVLEPDDMRERFTDNNAEGIAEGRVILYEADTLAAAEQMKRDGITADFIFIDADHSYEGCKGDIEAYLPLLRPGGVLCGHDVGSFPGVTQAVNELLPNAWCLPEFIWLWREGQKPLGSEYAVDWHAWTTRNALAVVEAARQEG